MGVVSWFSNNGAYGKWTRQKLPALLALIASLASFALAACSEPTLEASIQASTVSGPAPLEVTFSDTADLDVDSREWSFSDGSEAATTAGDAPASVTRTFTRAGDFTATVRSIRGEESVESTISFTVLPGPVAAITVEGVPESVVAGESAAVTVIAEDEFGNVIENSQVTFAADDGLGSIDSTGNFTASTTTGASDEALTVTVEHGGATVNEAIAVSVVPAALARLDSAPHLLTPLPARRCSFLRPHSMNSTTRYQMPRSAIQPGQMRAA